MSEVAQSGTGTTAVAPTSSEPALSSSTNNMTASDGLTDGSTANKPTGANVTNVPTEEKVGKGEVMITSHPINEGVLNYKGPGLKGLIFSKKYFWFSEQPLEHSHLSGYLGHEKSKDIAHANAAHATQTGKGLLFFAKRAEDKDHPQGILSLADMTDLAKGNFNDFSVSLHGHKHTFQALNKAERDGWLVRLEPELQSSKSHRDTLIGTPGYKSALEKYGKPTGAATTSKSRSLSRPGKKEKTKDAVVPTKDTTTTAPTTTKDTSASDPITKDFSTSNTAPVAGTGSTGDSTVPSNTTEPVTTAGTTSQGTAPTNATGTAAPLTSGTTGSATETPSTGATTTTAPTHHHGEEAAIGAGAAVVGAGAAKEAHKPTIDDEKAAKKEKKASRSQSRSNKRSSIFGGLLGKKEENDEKKAVKKEEKNEEKEVKKEIKAEENAVKQEQKREEKAEKQAEKQEIKAEKEEAKAEKAVDSAIKHEAKAGDLDAAAIASRVMGQPVVPDKDFKTSGLTEPLNSTTGDKAVTEASPAAASTTSPVTASADSPSNATASKANKRSSVFGGLFNKKDATKPTSTSESGPAVPAKDTPVKDSLTKDTLAKDTPSTVSSSAPQLDNPISSPTTGAVDAPVATEPATTTKASPTAQATSAATPTEKRRSSFFGGLGGTKKEKRTGGTSGDELTDSEGKKQSGGFGGLLRKASRAQPKGAAAGITPKTNGTTSSDPAKVPLPADTTPTDPAKIPLPAEGATTGSAINEPASGVTKGETAAEKSSLLPGEIGSNAIANTESKTPVEATA